MIDRWLMRLIYVLGIAALACFAIAVMLIIRGGGR